MQHIQNLFMDCGQHILVYENFAVLMEVAAQLGLHFQVENGSPGITESIAYRTLTLFKLFS